VASADELLAGQKAVQEIYVDEQLKEYIARVTHRTRSHADIGLGASSRGSLGLFRSSQARAALEGRDFVTPDDVKTLALPVLAHRLILKANAELRGLTPAKVLTQILDPEPVPPPTVGSRHEGQYQVGDNFEEQFKIENRSWIPIPLIELTDFSNLPGYDPGRVFSLKGRRTRRWTSRGRFKQRGLFTFGPVELRYG